jgi:transcriptional regulator with XRE-family HTH domain
MQNVIKRFILARRHLRLTQADLATSLGFKQSYISNIEKGRNEVTSNIVIAMYRLYNISPEWLITGQGNMSSNFHHDASAGKSSGEPVSTSFLSEEPHQNESKLLEPLQQTIKSQEITIQMQEKVIKMLEIELENLKQHFREQA